MILGTVFITIRAERNRRLAPKFTVGSVASCAFVLADGEAVDAEEGGNAVDDQDSPVGVYHKGEEEIQAQVPKL